MPKYFCVVAYGIEPNGSDHGWSGLWHETIEAENPQAALEATTANCRRPNPDLTDVDTVCQSGVFAIDGRLLDEPIWASSDLNDRLEIENDQALGYLNDGDGDDTDDGATDHGDTPV